MSRHISFATQAWRNAHSTGRSTLISNFFYMIFGYIKTIGSFNLAFLTSVPLAKWVMSLAPAEPVIDDNSYHMSQIFDTENYKNGDAENRKNIQLNSARYRYNYEQENEFFPKYFPDFDTGEFEGQKVLDLGSLTGGRLVAWAEKYRFGRAYGIDLREEYREASILFSEEKNVSAEFIVGKGEKLPYGDDYFDFIISSDVFEHVTDLEIVMKECRRVLKPGGQLFCVFPQFYQPLEAHFVCITKVPGLHWVFTPKTLTKAYYLIETERGTSANWYGRHRQELLSWEKLIGLNGTTVRTFNKYIRNQNWDCTFSGSQPILSDGRKARKPIFKILRSFFIIPAKLPFLNELFLGRVVKLLRKPAI